jgi:hypothetical protein
MSKRKLRIDDGPGAQFRALRQLPGVSQELGRNIVSLLRDDDRGKGVCKRKKEIAPEACGIQVRLRDEGNPEIEIVANSLPRLIEKKKERCPLFSRLLEDALVRNRNELTLVLAQDETTPGNVLSSRPARKTNWIFACFLEIEALWIDSMWLPVSCILAKEAQDAKYSYVEYTRVVLRHIHGEVQNGFALDASEGPVLVFLPKIILLGDHEALRALSGAKGSSGAKPCLKCCNILSQNRHIPPLHACITEANSANFLPQTEEGLREILRHFDSCRTKKSLQEAETALGWNAEMLRRSVVTDAFLSGWVTLQSFYFDSMHQYWSCGQVAQELGLWYTRLADCHITLDALRAWVAIGWKDLGRTPPMHLFSDKMFKRDIDYRGDAQACLVVFPLCWAYSMAALTWLKLLLP